MTTKPPEWRPVPGYEGLYEVSEDGRVRGLDREVHRGEGVMRVKGKELSPTRQDPAGHMWVWLTKEGEKKKAYIHRIVSAAWLGPCPEGQEVRHRNGDPGQNHYSNLRYGTRSENMWDRARHGNHPNKRKTHCKNGHKFTEENTYIRLPPPEKPEYTDHRACKACRRNRYHERKKAAK